MSKCCDVPWCLCEAIEKGLCAIHARYGRDFKPLHRDGEDDPPCEICDNTGECEECNGSGECECHCGNSHDCGECDGSGTCQECKRTPGPNLTRDERNYLAWAFSEGAESCPPFMTVRRLDASDDTEAVM